MIHSTTERVMRILPLICALRRYVYVADSEGGDGVEWIRSLEEKLCSTTDN